jgi:hypothetical protein
VSLPFFFPFEVISFTNSHEFHSVKKNDLLLGVLVVRLRHTRKVGFYCESDLHLDMKLYFGDFREIIVPRVYGISVRT